MNEAQEIQTHLVDRPNPPVRISFDESEIEALIESIRDKGILVPLLVRSVGDRYEVIDGDRRLEAATRLRIRSIPCMVRDATDSETHILRLLANLERSDPDPVSEAIYIAKVITSGVITLEQLASQLRRSEEWIQTRLDISTMPDFMQEALRLKTVSLGVAHALNELPDEDLKRRWLSSAVETGMTVRTAQDAVRDHLNLQARIAAGDAPAPPPEFYQEPPLVLYPCERCKEPAPLASLRPVRIHIGDCPGSGTAT